MIECPVTEFAKDEPSQNNGSSVVVRRTSLETFFVMQLLKLADNVKHFIVVADNWVYVDAFKHIIETKGASVTFLLDGDFSKAMSDVAHFVVNFTDPSIASLIRKDSMRLVEATG